MQGECQVALVGNHLVRWRNDQHGDAAVAVERHQEATGLREAGKHLPQTHGIGQVEKAERYGFNTAITAMAKMMTKHATHSRATASLPTYIWAGACNTMSEF